MTNPQGYDPHISRQTKLNTILHSAGLHGLILNPGPGLIYLTGLHFHLSERPVVVFFLPEQVPIIVLPELEQEKLKQLPFEMRAFPYGEDPSTWVASFRNAMQATRLDNARVGVEPRQLRFLEVRLLSAAAPKIEFVSAEPSLAKLRMYKDAEELAAMRKAVEIAQHALDATLPHVKIGMTERELASELTLHLIQAGCDSEMPFSPIISGGPNSANPHASPTHRKITVGDLLVIDWGASHDGYFSDITRTFSIGKIDAEYEKISRIVMDANAAAQQAARPGIAAQVVDQAARSVIEAAGYGKYFTHRTGHGLGMEGHEEPYIRAGNPLLLEPGMTFTIEPGIYLPDRNGVRIEDDVVLTASGSECLTSFPREVRPLP